MNLRQAFKQLQADILAGNAAILQGPPGFGKTDLMAKLARWYHGHMKAQSPNSRVGFSCFFMATQTPIGFTGLPWKGERTYQGVQSGVDGATGVPIYEQHKYTVTDPAIPQWYMATDLDTGEVRPANLFDGVLLVIEEWGQGAPETKRAGAEVLRIGGTPPFFLPPGSPRIACSNVDARDGVTKEFDFIIGRRASRTITGDVDVWIEDFADRPYSWGGREWNVLPFTKAWAKQHSEILFEGKPDKQGPWCNPRSLTMADRYVQTITELSGGVTPVNESTFIEGLEGYIGSRGTVQYCADLQFMLSLPTYEDVVKDPLGTPVPAKADLQMMMAYQMAGRVKPEHVAEVIQYMTKDTKPRMSQDMSVTFISSLIRRDYKSFMNLPAMQAWIAKNAHLVSIIATVSGR